ncbi:hypothetical protein BT69DRAFT_1350678 [Atractiella rhizophila]|nr:hypothetical protein BT69DRAFT_1350678 [Atractiella rhizophila]
MMGIGTGISSGSSASGSGGAVRSQGSSLEGTSSREEQDQLRSKSSNSSKESKASSKRSSKYSLDQDSDRKGKGKEKAQDASSGEKKDRNVEDVLEEARILSPRPKSKVAPKDHLASVSSGSKSSASIQSASSGFPHSSSHSSHQPSSSSKTKTRPPVSTIEASWEWGPPPKKKLEPPQLRRRRVSSLSSIHDLPALTESEKAADRILNEILSSTPAASPSIPSPEAGLDGHVGPSANLPNIPAMFEEHKEEMEKLKQQSTSRQEGEAGIYSSRHQSKKSIEAFPSEDPTIVNVPTVNRFLGEFGKKRGSLLGEELHSETVTKYSTTSTSLFKPSVLKQKSKLWRQRFLSLTRVSLSSSAPVPPRESPTAVATSSSHPIHSASTPVLQHTLYHLHVFKSNEPSAEEQERLQLTNHSIICVTDDYPGHNAEGARKLFVMQVSGLAYHKLSNGLPTAPAEFSVTGMYGSADEASKVVRKMEDWFIELENSEQLKGWMKWLKGVVGEMNASNADAARTRSLSPDSAITPVPTPALARGPSRPSTTDGVALARGRSLGRSNTTGRFPFGRGGSFSESMRSSSPYIKDSSLTESIETHPSDTEELREDFSNPRNSAHIDDVRSASPFSLNTTELSFSQEPQLAHSRSRSPPTSPRELYNGAALLDLAPSPSLESSRASSQITTLSIASKRMSVASTASGSSIHTHASKNINAPKSAARARLPPMLPPPGSPLPPIPKHLSSPDAERPPAVRSRAYSLGSRSPKPSSSMDNPSADKIPTSHQPPSG